MVLGIRSKSRKSVSIQVHYVIHIQEVKPWPPSQSLRSVQSVVLQWENGDQNSGSIASSAGDGKIEFNESFRLSVLLWREASKKSSQRDSFQKNCLEFHLYERQNDRKVKSQLLGSATINLADYGTLKETTAISTQVNCKRSFRSSAQPFLYVNIQPFDVESSGSSPKSSMSKELSLEKEESDSISQSLNDEDIEIASFTDDDNDEISSSTSQTVRSSSETTGDSFKISKVGTKGFNSEFVLPLETTYSNTHVKAEAESSKQFNGIKSPSSSMVMSSDMGSIVNDMPSFPEFPEESVKLADPSSKISESIQQFDSQNITKGGLVRVVSSALDIPVDMLSKIESSSQSQATQEYCINEENSRSGQKYFKDGPEKFSSVSNTGIFEDQVKTEQREKVQEEQVTIRTKLPEDELVPVDMQSNIESSSPSQVTQENSISVEISRRGLRYIKDGSEKVRSVSSTGILEDKVETEQKENAQEEQVTVRTKIPEDKLIPVDMQSKIESSSQSQVTQENNISEEKCRSHQRYIKDGSEKVRSVSNTGILEDKVKTEQKENTQEEQVTVRTKLPEDELIRNFSEDYSRRKGKLKSSILPISRQSHEQASISMNDKPENINSVELPSDCAENYGQFRNQALNQVVEINTLNNIHAGAACHEGTNMNDPFFNNKTKIKSEVELLRAELREAAALEVSLYSVVAEHVSSANKVHAPARRLSRFYFHANRDGAPTMRASAAQSVVSGFVLVSKACGNDVPRLTFWFSNLILLRAIVSEGSEKIQPVDGPQTPHINSECDENGLIEGRPPPHEGVRENTLKYFQSWEDPQTFLVALEKVEAWIFSRIVESVWWQTLTPYMQSAAAKSSISSKLYGWKHRPSGQEQGTFSIDLWKRAFKDACERLCPLRAGGHECGCSPVIARLVMEQLVNRLDVAMLNAILRESADEMPTDPISDPISDPKVLPVPAGKSGFGAGAQLKNAIGNWSIWLSNLFGIDESDSPEARDENDDNKIPECETSFKAFYLLNALSDLMMLPFDMLADGSTRKEVCPKFGVSLIKRVLDNFTPDEFCPGPIPDAVLEALNSQDIRDDEGSITSLPCTAASTFYSPPKAASVMGILQEVGIQTSFRSRSSLLKKSYTSDDELDELDSPLSAIGINDPSLAPEEQYLTVKRGRKVARFELLREVWRNSE